MKGGKMAKRSSFGSIMRRRLSDITNSLPQPSKSPIDVDKLLQPAASSVNEQIAFLVKENMALAKLVADKNKIIEMTGIELQKLRVDMQKLQLQNWNLAQSNSQMLSELNSGREKLRALQHEVLCQKAVLSVKNQELEEREKIKGQANGFQLKKEEEAMEEDNNTQGDKKSCKSRRGPTRSKSIGHSNAIHQVDKGTDGNKRRCLRRWSASNFQAKKEEPKNLFEIDDLELTLSEPMVEDGPAASMATSSSVTTKEEKHKMHCRESAEPLEEPKRFSIGRPSRKAAEKVQSYRETPLNIKMRRPE